MASLVTEELVGDWEVSVVAGPAPEAPSQVVVTSKLDASKAPLSYPMQFVHGVAYPLACNQARWTKLREDIRFRDEDVMVVSYPKCGTTWAEQCVLLLQTRGDVSRLNPATKNVYQPDGEHVGKIWPEACVDQGPGPQEKAGLEFAPITLAQFDAAPSPRTIKTHAPVHLLLGSSSSSSSSSSSGSSDGGGSISGGIAGLPSKTKVLVVTRNPLDACVSCYYHAWNPHKAGWPFSAWAAAWLSGNVPHGGWFDWVKHWSLEAKAHPDRVLWVQYESLKADAQGTVQRVADFLGVGEDAEVVRIAVEASSFESMKEQASEKGGDTIGHLRKGVSGDWRNHFTPAMAEEFFAAYREHMAGTGIVFSLGEGQADLVAPP